MKKLVLQAEVIPRGYGVAWTDGYRHAAVCYPIGINVVAYLIREIYLAIKCPEAARFAVRGEYERGYRDATAAYVSAQEIQESMR